MGGKVWETDEQTFTVKCGVESAGIEVVPFGTDLSYDIIPEGELPYFSFEEYRT